MKLIAYLVLFVVIINGFSMLVTGGNSSIRSVEHFLGVFSEFNFSFKATMNNVYFISLHLEEFFEELSLIGDKLPTFPEQSDSSNWFTAIVDGFVYLGEFLYFLCEMLLFLVDTILILVIDLVAALGGLILDFLLFFI